MFVFYRMGYKITEVDRIDLKECANHLGSPFCYTWQINRPNSNYIVFIVAISLEKCIFRALLITLSIYSISAPCQVLNYCIIRTEDSKFDKKLFLFKSTCSISEPWQLGAFV